MDTAPQQLRLLDPPAAVPPGAAGDAGPFARPGTALRASRTVAVLGACGGAGTSTLAAALAHALRGSGERAVLVDLDVPGAGADVLLGIEDEPGARWPELAAARGDVDGEGLVAALPRWRRVPVLSGTRAQAAPPDGSVVLDVATGLLRAGESVVLDLPRASGWSHAARLLAAAADTVLLVVPSTVPGVAGAASAAVALQEAGAGDPWVVARRPAPGRVDATAVEAALGLDVVAELPWDPRLAAAVERGEGPRVGRRAPVGRTSARLAAALARAS
ncbi:septum site-determining protein Ssd [Isoptericola sp. BMS4]|uniref:septum site-determining protein Ssd n=1 Tax=Isoptericola sp. BMS4 TaxID=2527875 RepID=UPI00142086E3|nr:septum site-determining protein Ssd [Isoptericola sp. BMS4]